MDIITMITTYNTAMTDAPCAIFGKERPTKEPWIIKDVLDLCDERRDLIKKCYIAEGAHEYRTGLGKVLLKNKRFSAEGQNIAQNGTTNHESCADNAVLD